MQEGELDDVARARRQHAVEPRPGEERAAHVALREPLVVGVGGPQDVPPPPEPDELRQQITTTPASNQPGLTATASSTNSETAWWARCRASWTTPVDHRCGLSSGRPRAPAARRARRGRRAQRQARRRGVLLQPAPPRARDRHDVLALRQHPRQRDLRRLRAGALGDRADVSTIASFFARTASAKRGSPSGSPPTRTTRCCPARPVRKPRPSGENGMNAAPCSAHHGSDAVERVARPQRELALHAGDRVDRVRALELLDAHLRQPDRPRLAGGDGLGHRAPGLLERHVLVDAVQLVEVDAVGLQAPQRGVDRRADVLGRPSRRIRIGSVDSTTSPAFVASTASSRRSASARPTSSSFVNGPYMSAVSRNVTPSSSARWIVAIDSASSRSSGL